MKNNGLYIIWLIWLFVSCNQEIGINNEIIEVEEFHLLEDYSNFMIEMKDTDTIYVAMNLSSCLFFAIEKMMITKVNDSVVISPEIMKDGSANHEFIKGNEIKISMHDTVWKFDEFLMDNVHRLDSVDGRTYPLSLYCNSEKLKYFTTDLGDLNDFISDYSVVMLNLDSTKDYYPIVIFPEEFEIIDVSVGDMIIEIDSLIEAVE